MNKCILCRLCGHITSMVGSLRTQQTPQEPSRPRQRSRLPCQYIPRYKRRSHGYQRGVLVRRSSARGDCQSRGHPVRWVRPLVHNFKELRNLNYSFSTLRTPQILELSGIGRKDVLEKAGVSVKVNLSGVGENMQDHLLGGVSFGASDKLSTHRRTSFLMPGSRVERRLPLRDFGCPARPGRAGEAA